MTTMQPPYPDAADIRAHVLRGIAGNRTPGLHFPGFFLDIQWPEVADKATRVTIADGPHCRDANSEMDVVNSCENSRQSHNVEKLAAAATTQAPAAVSRAAAGHDTL